MSYILNKIKSLLVTEPERSSLQIKPFGPEEYKYISYVPAKGGEPKVAHAVAGHGWGPDALLVTIIADGQGADAQVLIPDPHDGIVYPKLVWDGSYEAALEVMTKITQPVSVAQLRSLGFRDADG